MNNLSDTKIQLKNMIPDGIAPTIKALKDLLPESSKRFEDVLLIESRQNEANKNRLRELMDNKELQIIYNKIREDLLELIDSIEEADFDTSAESSKFTETQKVKKGNILHRIPSSMQLNKETRCVVRIALDEDTIIENIDLDESVKLQSIRISDIMQVEMLDSSDPKNFAIRTLSSAEQFIDEDAYTEWLFYVKPLNEGSHPLLLKVSVIELIHGKERKREIVLEEVVEIVTAEVKEDENAAFKPADVSLSLSGAEAETAVLDGSASKSKASGGKPLKKMVYSLVFLTVIGGSVMAFSSQQFAWINASQLQNTVAAYERYLKKYPDGKHKEDAVWQIATLDASPKNIQKYLHEFPEGKTAALARKELEKFNASPEGINLESNPIANKEPDQNTDVIKPANPIVETATGPVSDETQPDNLATDEIPPDNPAALETPTDNPDPIEVPTAPVEIDLADDPVVKAGKFTDSRDGQVYKAALINRKIWMMENLNFDLGPGSWIYNNKNENSEKYGRLYDWNAAKKACPPGWHLPTATDWQNMIQSYGGAAEAYDSFLQSENSKTFLAGMRNPEGVFNSLGVFGLYWSSTAADANNARYYYFDSLTEPKRLLKYVESKASAYSCRCVKD